MTRNADVAKSDSPYPRIIQSANQGRFPLDLAAIARNGTAFSACDVRHSSNEYLAEPLADDVAIPAKYWSEWQDLNLRPPRPERGRIVPVL
jgi:hypothetical protein